MFFEVDADPAYVNTFIADILEKGPDAADVLQEINFASGALDVRSSLAPRPRRRPSRIIIIILAAARARARPNNEDSCPGPAVTLCLPTNALLRAV